MSMGEKSLPQPGRQGIWRAVGDELREIVWLASTIGALSVAGVGLAVLLAGA
jgi:hypothetical protein